MANGELKAKYVFDDDFDPEYITGAFGGVLPSGELVVDFYLERTPIPYETVQTIDENGKMSGSLTVTAPDLEDFKLRRTIKSGITNQPPIL